MSAINIDAMSDNELSTMAWSASNSKTYRRPTELEYYAHSLLAARCSRRAGYITEAQLAEHECDRIYNKLPADQKW
jgi:hypothetical protein